MLLLYGMVICTTVCSMNVDLQCFRKRSYEDRPFCSSAVLCRGFVARQGSPVRTILPPGHARIATGAGTRSRAMAYERPPLAGRQKVRETSRVHQERVHDERIEPCRREHDHELLLGPRAPALQRLPECGRAGIRVSRSGVSGVVSTPLRLISTQHLIRDRVGGRGGRPSARTRSARRTAG